MKKQVFAWIKWLMVISFIGILAAILLPALSRTKAVARKAICVNPQRQIGLARQL